MCSEDFVRQQEVCDEQNIFVKSLEFFISVILIIEAGNPNISDSKSTLSN